MQTGDHHDAKRPHVKLAPAPGVLRVIELRLSKFRDSVAAYTSTNNALFRLKVSKDYV
jgi:hypothetical protein